MENHKNFMESKMNESKPYLKFSSLSKIIFWDFYSLSNKNVIESKYPIVSLKEVLTQRKGFITIDDSASYKRCRAQVQAKGIVLRDEIIGKEIKTKKQQVCKVDDFLVAEIDAKVGGYGIVPDYLEGAIVSGHYFLFEIDKTKLLPEYLGIVVKLNDFAKQVKATGSTNYAAIRPYHVLEYVIPLPTIEEQERIVSAYIEKVESAKKLEEEAEELEKEVEEFILNSLGIKISNAEKNKGLNIIKSSSFERWGVDYLFKLNSLRFIALGKYEAVKVANILASLQYGISEKAFVEPIGLPMLRMNNIYKSELVIDNLKYINSIEQSKLPNLLLSNGDLLFNRTNSKELVGKTAVFDLDGEYLFASYLIRLKFDTSKVNVYYMNYLFNSSIGRTQIDMTSRQILGQANINSQELQEFIFPIPPLLIQNKIVDNINTIKYKIKNNINLSLKLRSEAASDFEKEIFN